MPLEPYQYMPAGSKASTPSPTIHQGGHGRRASASSLWSSPDSVDTRATTPSISSSKYHGRDILPRIRPCDQNLEPDFTPASYYRRAQSHDCDPSLDIPTSRPGYQRSITCPPETEYIPTPISATSTQDSWNFSNFDSPAPFTASYGSRSLGHARSSSQPIDVSTLRRHVMPYRNMPVYTTQSQSPQYTTFLEPQAADFFSIPTIAGPHPLSRGVTPEQTVEFEPYIFETGEEPYNTIMAYLTEPNPSIRLIQDVRQVDDSTAKHWWWDIRQLRTWEDFKLDTIMSIKDFHHLLNINVKSTGLPAPELNSLNYRPDSVPALHDTINQYYATKVNAGLRAAGSSRYAYMRQVQTTRDGPHFFSSHASEYEISSGRGRCVGLVKAYESWNTAMRKENAIKQVEYLKGLAQLQRMMREQECRYGYIMTEIELVCVRMGVEEGVPFFGRLELSKSIPIEKTKGLTACLALWYLHMLTLDSPLEGQLGWWVNIGAPAEKTRSKACADEERDEWIRKQKGPHTGELRKAKRARGWIWPSDEYKPKIEGGKPKPRRS